ncbi:hypothetical protein [Endozoicomonas numazuensis]|uniref:Uncharacterized protein n=1 Tax=Endozoicomonas numazuensis TaxID=1137799 RepID=A0A081N9I3_9GAMM|nr:hypothetical protein [Endozoicomonas numazuensis]KEQ15106.1 hypothetical protein GZ78_24935 [Endozoicomonas numazuensis]
MRTSVSILEQFGFEFGKNGAHSAHTTMLDEQGILIERTEVDTRKDRGKDVATAPWLEKFGGDRVNDYHLSSKEKQTVQAAAKKTKEAVA